jgi:hypothetical protein
MFFHVILGPQKGFHDFSQYNIYMHEIMRKKVPQGKNSFITEAQNVLK